MALKIDELNALYREAEEADREVFAEQRSNVLLVAGEHYSKSKGAFDKRVRQNADLTEQQKLRLTQNHVHRIQRHYVTSILSHAPGVTILPQNEKELQDKKSAELNKAVWEDAKQKYRLKEKIREFANDHITLGEVACKIFWDPNAGLFKGYEQALHPETGEPQFEEGPVDPATGLPTQGAPVADETKPVFTGDFVFERIFSFNLLRHPGATSMRDPQKPWIVRKMVDKKTLKERYKDDSDKLKMVEGAAGDEFIVFDANRAAYDKKKDQVLLREFYWPSGTEYPQGHFAIATETGILEEDDLPYGVFPIVWNGCDEFQGSPRRRSVIKQARPFQAEINRASSQCAMAQITIGDDKVLYQKGTKFDQGSLLPGVRGIAYQGAAPTVLPGRDGSQFLPYISNKITELYKALMAEEINEEQPAQLDPYSLLQRSIQQQQKYALYSENFETFLVDLCTTFLKLAKKYLPDDALIPAIGRSEMINISEFRSTSELCYQIKVEPQSDTVETKLGKQLALNHALQYVGNQLSKEDIARVMRAMPYGNFEAAFAPMLLDEDCINNDLLALDRGEKPEVDGTVDPDKALKAVVNRMKQGDFKALPPEVQQNYQAYKQQLLQIQAEQAAKLAAAKAETIPTGGAMIACDMYVPDETDPSKTPKRVRVPYQALEWLVQTLEHQGQSLQKLEAQNQGTIAEIADMLLKQGARQGGPQPVPNGQTSPGGYIQ